MRTLGQVRNLRAVYNNRKIGQLRLSQYLDVQPSEMTGSVTDTEPAFSPWMIQLVNYVTWLLTRQPDLLNEDLRVLWMLFF